jgi:hypothetical protein
VVNGSKGFINSDLKRKRGTINFPSRGSSENKVVYSTISIPIPVYITIPYKIKVKTQYQQQMNEILAPFLTYTGGNNYLILKYAGHRYEGFLGENIATNNNINDLGTEERVFESIVTLSVLGHIFSGDVNEKQNKLSVRENMVVVTFPKEHLIMGDVPEWTTGSYYGTEKSLDKVFFVW